MNNPREPFFYTHFLPLSFHYTLVIYQLREGYVKNLKLNGKKSPGIPLRYDLRSTQDRRQILRIRYRESGLLLISAIAGETAPATSYPGELALSLERFI